jgi:hypothetical protein
VLARYLHIEDIPQHAHQWDVTVRGATKLAATLDEQRELALLFRTLATLRTDGQVGEVDEWRWIGPSPQLASWAERLGAAAMVGRAERLAAKRA